MNYFLFLDLLVLIVLAVCLLGGLIKGFNKSLRRLIAVLIPTICFFIFLTPITKAVMKTEIDLSKINNIVEVIPEDYATQTYSINDLISEVVAKNVYADDPTLQQNSELKEFASAVSVMIIKIFVYFIGLLFVWITSWIITLIIRIIFGKTKREKRLLGMAIGCAHFVVSFILVLLPLFGTLSITSSIVQTVAEYQDSEDSSMSDVLEVTYMYENSITKKFLIDAPSKIFSKNSNLSYDAKFVAGGLSFKVDEEKVNLLDEYEIVEDALPSIIKVMEIVNNINNEQAIISLSTLSDEDIQNLSNVLRNSKLIRAVIPVAIEYAVYDMREQENNYQDIIVQVGALNWDEQLIGLADLIDVLQEHNDLEINVNDIEQMLKVEGFINLVEDLVNGTLQIELITDILIPLGINALEEKFTNGEFAQYEIDFTDIKNIKWKIDGALFVSTAINIYKEYLDTNIDFTDLKVALNDDKLADFVTYTFDEIKKSTIITDTLLPIGIQVLIANLEQQESLTNLGIDFDALKEVDWKDNLDSIKILLHDLIESYQTLEIDPDNFKEVLKNNKLQTELDKAITNILNCDVFSNYLLPVVMNSLISKFEENPSISSFGFDFVAIKNTNWKEEIANLKGVLIEFLTAYQDLDFNKDEWMNILDNEKLGLYINNIYSECKSSSLVAEHILPKLPNKLHELIDNMDSSIDISFLKELITEESIDSLLTNDVDKLIELFKNIKNLGLLDGTTLDYTNPNVQDQLINVIKKVFDLSVVEGKEEGIFKSILNIINIENTLSEYGITLNYDNISNWNNEVDYICTIFKNVMSLTGGLDGLDFTSLLTEIKNDEEKTKVAEVVAAIGNSDIFGESIYQILDIVSKEIDSSCNISLTNEEKNIIENVNGWNFEAIHTLTLVEKIESIDFEQTYNNLDAVQMKEIMVYCSESVISTKILGTILNNVFYGVISQDFTNQKVMKSSADVVYNAITIASIMKDETLDLSDNTVTNQLIDSIENIASSDENIELTNEFINNIVGNDTYVEYTKEDINDAASVVESVITSYQNSPDPDNFDLSSLPEEDLEKLENSDIAKAILESLFA